MNEIRAGIIGLDMHFEELHLPCMRRACGLRIVAGCDVLEHRRDKARTLLGKDVTLYADHRQMLAAGGLDAVYVLTPPADTERIVPDVAAAGLALFCEKHLDSDSRQTRQLAGVCAATGIPHLVTLNRRFGPFTARLREWLRTATVPTRIEVFCHRVWTGSPVQSLGPAVHTVDLAIALAGPVRRVTAGHSAPRGSGFGAFVAMIEFASGAIGSFVMDNRMPVPAEEYHFNVVSADTLRVERLSLKLPTHHKPRTPGYASRVKMCYRNWVDDRPVWDEEKEEYTRPDLQGDDDVLIGGGYQDMHETFVRNLLAGVRLGPTFAEALHSTEVAEAIQAGQSREFDVE